MVEKWIENGKWVKMPNDLHNTLEASWDNNDMNDSLSTFFTSGTTGAAKEIQFSKSQIIASTFRTANFFGLKSSDHVLHTLPHTFVAGRMNILRALVLEQNIFYLSNWKSKEDWEQLRELGMDWWPCTPMMLETVIDLGIDLSFIKKILLGGAPVSQGLLNKLQGWTTEVWEGYGMTETLTHIACRKINQGIPSGFTPMPKVRISFLEDQLIKVEDEELQNTVVTQDRGREGGDGTFMVLGRMDDVINSGGIKIFPEHVEAFLNNLIPGKFAVVKQQDDHLGEKVICLYEDREWNPDGVDWRLVFELHPYWRPKQFVQVNALPTQSNGKLIRTWKG